jgi:hypothetical protein
VQGEPFTAEAVAACSACSTLRAILSGWSATRSFPRNRGYWIEAIDKTGSRRPIDRFDTEDVTMQRLRVLQANADMLERKNDILLPKKRRR